MQKTDRLIQILPQQRMIRADSGQRLLEVLIRNGIFLRSDCGGKGKCGKCKFHKISDGGHFEEVESCQYGVEEDIIIKIPESSIASSFILDKAPLTFPDSFKKQFDNNVSIKSYGIAVDLGTTTIAVYLCNIVRGEVISSIAVKNPQALHGDDVISRIGLIGQGLENLVRLQELVVKGIEWGVKKLLSSLSDKGISISGMVVVGNPAMIHILAGVNPKSIGMAPYEPVFYDAKSFQSDNLGFNLKMSPVKTLPNVSGFIGGDILAAALAVELDTQPAGTLLVDLGTNGELLLKSHERLYATSCATGPAFEGATLSCGMQATPGAINSITIDNCQKLSEFTMIDPSGKPQLKPSGICGAGVINAVAQFCKKQIITPGGALNSGEKLFTIIPANSKTGQSSIYISQKDVRSVQLGKSALITGIEFLLKNAGLGKPEKIIIAGALGSYLNKSDLIQLGMIPKIHPDKIEAVGNAAGSGAVIALCDKTYIQKAMQMAAKIKIIDLACDIEFQNAFIKNLNFLDN